MTEIEKPALQGEMSVGVRKGVLFFCGGEFTVQFDRAFMVSHKYEYEVFVDLVKRLRQRTFDDRRATWNIPVAEDSIRCLQQFTVWGISATKEAREKLSSELKKIAEVDAVAQAATEASVDLVIPNNEILNTSLKNYQKTGVKFMATVERAYLADDMGLGKTLQILATFELKQSYPALVICPVKLKQNWITECRKWLPHRSASPLANKMAEITVLGYSEIQDYVNYGLMSPKKKERDAAKELATRKSFFVPGIRRFAAVAADEGHWIKNAESRRSQACLALAHFSGSQVRIVASGTPIENGRPSELIAPLKFLDQLEAMGGWYHYATRYCGGSRTRFGFDMSGATNTQELHAKLSKVCMIRRRKAEVLKELPDKIQTIYDAELSNWTDYRRIESDIMGFMMEQRGRLATEKEIRAQAMIKLGMLRRAVGIGKVEFLIDWVNNFLESGEKFVLYANTVDVQRALVSSLSHWNPAVVLGNCEDVKAQEEKFAKNLSCRLFIGSVKAAGFGLTLTTASHVGLAELEWTDSKHQQVFDRLHRIGQKECVNCYYFLARGTIDDDMWEIVSQKAKITASAVDGESEAQAAVLDSLLRRRVAQAA